MKNIIFKIPIILSLINLFGYLMYQLHDYLMDGMIKDIINIVCYIFHPTYMILFSGLISAIAITMSVFFIYRKAISLTNNVVPIVLNLAYIILYVHWFIFSA
ncbi:hypothetical protein Bccel_1763 [Pseudobacteroides cellulosolvens ATCC 35603 = DSM 2933]|uniref:Uncharacterized protein n=1 Tax=Pseudobacteroides cellulosolvens ATCC 35603 = DSM 2933 TaxID=398512 RepID=A0A0L6JL81_9FIRM|nr:hypothetical protein Bccel_1763 [Pseudobacteroides cellulosolvens ATCC 35603 = DSM 2933]